MRLVELHTQLDAHLVIQCNVDLSSQLTNPVCIRFRRSKNPCDRLEKFQTINRQMSYGYVLCFAFVLSFIYIYI